MKEINIEVGKQEGYKEKYLTSPKEIRARDLTYEHSKRTDTQIHTTKEYYKVFGRSLELQNATANLYNRLGKLFQVTKLKKY
jgi:hypothetical protein